MHKKDFIKHIVATKGVKHREASAIIDTFTEAIIDALGKGETVDLIGFGSFYTSQVKERQGRHPQNGDIITIPAYVQPKFSAGQKLKDVCNRRR